MRKIDASGKTAWRDARSSAIAEARSRPNGFSTMTRASCGEPGGAEAPDHGREQAGGMAR